MQDLIFFCNFAKRKVKNCTIMTTVSTKTFLENPIRFFNLARKEDVAVKRGGTIFQIIPKPEFENPSPSGDPYFADPRNVKDILESSKQAREGKFAKTLLTSDDIEKYLGLA